MKACIIGTGSIGALKPNNFESKDSKDVLTHAHALYFFRKKGILEDFFLIDFDKEKLQKACEKWKCRGFNNLENLKRKYKKIDIFVVSVNTEYHYSILEDIIYYFKPKIVIVEKPFCSNYKQALTIHKKYANKGIPIVINYTRRFCHAIQTLKNEIDEGEYGKVKACNIIYVRGFMRDASHALDLCNFFFGQIKTGKILGSVCNGYDDYSKDDLTIPVWLEYAKCKNVYLTPADGRDYSIFEFDILTEQGRINIIDHSKKIKIFNKEPEKVYGEFHSMSYEANEIINNDLENALYFLHGNVIGYIQSNNKSNYNLFCTSTEGLKVQEIIRMLYGGNK